MSACGCGIPNRANYLVSLVIGRSVDGDTETGSVEAYACAEHVPPSDSPGNILHPDIVRAGWEVLEGEITHIRY